MRLNRKSSYGLIAALDLATRGAETPISARSIASKYGLPASFVEKILHELAGAGLVEGPEGSRRRVPPGGRPRRDLDPPGHRSPR